MLWPPIATREAPTLNIDPEPLAVVPPSRKRAIISSDDCGLLEPRAYAIARNAKPA
jgi:hypothetical protein